MCEIAVIDPDEVHSTTAKQQAMQMFRSQGSSLGLMAVITGEERLQYEVERWVEEKPGEVMAFFEAHEDEAWRIIIHARLATSGERGIEGAHPIEVDCPECEVEYIIHNGMVNRKTEERLREKHTEDGHEYTTNVDTEVLAHELAEIPEDSEDLPQDLLGFQPGVIWAGPEQVYIYGSARGYHLADDGRMCKRNRRQVGPDYREEDYEYVRLYTTTNA